MLFSISSQKANTGWMLSRVEPMMVESEEGGRRFK
jgi:hypothetical protein